MNPENGLCLNAIHDRAFDLGLITITPDYTIMLSNFLHEFHSDDSIALFFKSYENKKIILPERHYPNIEFLEYHYKNIFKKISHDSIR